MATQNLGLSEHSPAHNDSDFKALLQRLSDEPLDDVVHALSIERSISEEEARECRDAFLRYLALTKLTGRSLAPDRTADAFWHTFLTFTRKYADFCDRTFGTFIHHDRPVDHAQLEGPPEEIAQLMWSHFEVRADCNNTCHADWERA